MVNPDLKKRIELAATEAASLAFLYSPAMRELVLEARNSGVDVKAELVIQFRPLEPAEPIPSLEVLDQLYQLEDTREEN